MCPNCILNQVGLQPGLYVAFAVCAIFFVAGIAAMWWAFRNGEFEDIEACKFEMLDEDDSTDKAERARQAVEKLRQQKAWATAGYAPGLTEHSDPLMPGKPDKEDGHGGRN